MKTKKMILLIFFSFVFFSGFSQEKTRKQLREKERIEKERQIEILVNSKEFVFIAERAFPQGFKTVDLTNNSNYIEFKPDFIKSEMPFFGRGYSGIEYGGGDGGLKFEGKPTDFTIERGKKGYEIKASVKGNQDMFKIYLSVFFEGSATLSIISNNRSTISYNGEIFKIEKK